MLATKSILLPREDSDGTRISIMSRHTLNDGITPDPRITPGSYDEWMPDLAPPARLLGDYYKRGLHWEQFEQRYCDYLQRPEVAARVQNIAVLGLASVITLLCIEELPNHCHRRLLAEECKRYQPHLSLVIR